MNEEQQFVALTPETEELITRYLLDQMGERERAQVEERLCNDPFFYEVLSSVEDDLIVRYLRGDLKGPILLRFNEVYLNSPAKQARIESTRKLQKAVFEIAECRKPAVLERNWIRAVITLCTAVIFGVVLSFFRMSLLPFMFLLALLAVFVAVFLYEWTSRFSKRNPHDVIRHLRSVNFEEMSGLFDVSKEGGLRHGLSPGEFRRSQWKRCRLARRYVNDVAHNAKVFQEWGRYEKDRSEARQDPEASRASVNLTLACARCRLYAFAVSMRLWLLLSRMVVLRFLAPPSLVPSGKMVPLYERITKAAIELSAAYGTAYQQEFMQMM